MEARDERGKKIMGRMKTVLEHNSRFNIYFTGEGGKRSLDNFGGEG